MKPLLKLTLLLLTALLAACGEEEVKNDTFKVDLTKKVYIKADYSTPQKAPALFAAENTNRLTPLEVVKQGYMMFYYNDKMTTNVISAGWSEKDTLSSTPAFIQPAAAILGLDGFNNPIVVEDWLYAYDCVIVNKERDTIGYIPNNNFIQARLQIFEALENKDTTSVYDLFQNAFKFRPITGAEYSELKNQNLN